MPAEDPDENAEPTYRPASRREEAVNVIVSVGIGLVAYTLMAVVPVLGGLAGPIPVSPSLLAIGIALTAYVLLDTATIRR